MAFVWWHRGKISLATRTNLCVCVCVCVSGSVLLFAVRRFRAVCRRWVTASLPERPMARALLRSDRAWRPKTRCGTSCVTSCHRPQNVTWHVTPPNPFYLLQDRCVLYKCYTSVIQVLGIKGVFFRALTTSRVIRFKWINPLNAELNPICYLLALLGAHHFLHVSRIRVKSLTLRLLMSYIYIYIYIYIWHQ